MKRTALSFFLLLIGLVQISWAQPQIAWANGTGSSGIDQGNAIAVDAGRNVMVAGDFNGSMDFDPGPGFNTLTSMWIELPRKHLVISALFVKPSGFGSRSFLN